MAKTPKSVIDQRITEIYGLLVDGADFQRVKRHATEQGWGVSDRMLRFYVARAYDTLDETLRLTREQHLSRHLRIRRTLYGMARSQGDVRAALAVADSEAKLLGLDRPVPEEQREALWGDVFASLPPAVADSIRRKLAARLAGEGGMTVNGPVQVNVYPPAEMPHEPPPLLEAPVDVPEPPKLSQGTAPST